MIKNTLYFFYILIIFFVWGFNCTPKKSSKPNQSKKITLLVALLDIPNKRIEIQEIKNGITQQNLFIPNKVNINDFVFFDSIYGQYLGNNFFELRDSLVLYLKDADIDRNQVKVLGDDRYISMDSIGEAFLYNHTFDDGRTVFIYNKNQLRNNGEIKFNQREMTENTSSIKYLFCPEVTDYYGNIGTSYLSVYNSLKNQIFTFDSVNYSNSISDIIINKDQIRDNNGVLSYLKYSYNKDKSGVSEVSLCKYSYIENVVLPSEIIKIDGGFSSDNYYHFINGDDTYVANDKTIFYASDGVADDTIFHTNELEILDFYIHD